MSTRSPSIEEIIDRCLEDIAAGRATIEECLDRWPEHRDELEPLLRAGIALAEIPVPDIRPDPARRAAFMAELGRTPQQRSRFRLPGRPAFLDFGAPMLRFATVAAPAAVIAFVALVVVMGTNPSTSSAATLTVFAGEIEQRANDGWIALADGAAIHEGDSIRTGEGAFALITFPDGSTAAVDASTVLTFQRIAVDGRRAIEILQDTGRVWNDVVPVQAGESYVVRTPHAVVQARGTVFETIVDGETAVFNARGVVDVIRGEDTVQIQPGQFVRATAQSISPSQAAPRAAEIRVNGPVAAYLASAQGAATGILPNGVEFRQVPGVATTGFEANDTSRIQRITIGDTPPGRYSLILRRVAGGEGTILLETADSSLTIRVPERAQTARLDIEITRTEDGLTVRALDTDLVTIEEAPPVRVVETARTRAAVDLASLLASVTGAADPGSRDGVPGTRTPRGEGNREGRGSGRDDEHRDGVRATPDPTPRTTDVPERVDRWASRLSTALRQRDVEAVERLLQELTDADGDPPTARIEALSAALTNPGARALILEALDEDLFDDLRHLVPGLRDSLPGLLPSPDRGDDGDRNGDEDRNDDDRDDDDRDDSRERDEDRDPSSAAISTPDDDGGSHSGGSNNRRTGHRQRSWLDWLSVQDWGIVGGPHLR